MKRLLSRPWRIIPLILMALLVSFGCLPGIPKAVTVKGDVVLGSGAFSLADTRAGLSNLTSYKATLSLAFVGTRDGRPSKWSRTYVMLTTQEPAARVLTLQRTGDLTNLDPVFLAEAGGAAYERRGENACYANLIQKGNSLGDRLEPAGLLFGVIGAVEAGSETLNHIAANHYTFDERALGQSDIDQSTGELWVATAGGYIVSYKLTTKGKSDYFGQGVEGTLTWDYELTEVNKPTNIKLPVDCPAGKVDAPQLPDATNVLNMPSELTYDTSTRPADAAAFYQKQIPDRGWKLLGKPIVTDKTAMLEFTQVDQLMTIVIIVGDLGTKVHILLSSSRK